MRKYLSFASTENTGSFKLDVFGQQKSFYEAQLNGQGETFYYSKTEYEASPLNRVERSYAPGNSWVNSGLNGNLDRGVKLKYWLNTEADDVKIWSVSDVSGSFGTYNLAGVYGAGELYKNVTEDEGGAQVLEFKDKEGRVLLKKVQLLQTYNSVAVKDDGTGRGYGGWLCTYYLYDDLGQLRAVLQGPAGDEPGCEHEK